MKLCEVPDEDEWFRLISDASGAAIFILVDMRPVYVTAAAEQLTGYPKEDLLQADFPGLFCRELRAAIVHHCEPGQDKVPAKPNLEARLRTRAGEEKWVFIALGPVKYKGVPACLATLFDITERKRAEGALIMGKRFSDAIIDSILGVFYVLDVNGNFVRDNRYHQILLGYSEEEILKMNALDTIAEEDRDLIAGKIRDAFEKGFTTVSAHILTRAGKKIPFLFTGYPAEIDGKPYLIGMGVDISERVKAEKDLLKAYERLSTAEEKLRSQYEELKKNQELLQQSEQDYKNILDNIQDGFYRSDVGGNLIMISPSGARILGYRSPEEIVGSNIQEKLYADPKDRDILIKSMEAKGVIENYEIRIRRKDGSIRTVSINSHFYYDRAGKPAGVEGVFHDITRRKQAEEAIKASENMYRAIFNNTGAATIIIAPDTTIKLANSGWEKLTGISRDRQENQMKWPAFFVKEDAERMKGYHYARRKDPSLAPNKYECRLIDVRGEMHYCLAQVDMIPGTKDSVASLVDITDRKKAVIALQESEQKFRVLAETSTAGIFFYQGDRFVYANPAMERITGYSKEELLRINFWDWVHPDYQKIVMERGWARQRDEQVPSGYEVKIITRTGKERWVIITAGHVDFEGKPAGLATIFDITDRKYVEEELEDAKNQAELFLDLMGHDISNMNQIGVGYLEMARELMPLDETTKELIGKPLETLYDSSRLIADVNKLQRIATSEIRLEKTDVEKMLREVVGAYRGMPDIKTTIRNLHLSECPAMANEMLYDVFSNILWDCIKNATGDNSIDISLHREIKGHQPQCVILIDNHGAGLNKEQKIHLFEQPRKGMKRTGGRGIGLYLAKSIVDRFGGTLKVEDLEPGNYKKGTRFIITLPACS